jgi:hypothetical protein
MLDLLRAKLTEPRTIAEQVTELAQVPARASTDPARLHDEVAAWLVLGAGTSTPEGPPVLEAKVHLFLRGLPHLMRCTGDGEHLLLDGAESCPVEGCGAQATTPLGVCLGCGQDFDLEADRPGGWPRRYVARRTAFDPVEQPLPRTRWYPSRRCVRCGASGAGAACLGCGAPTRSVLVCEADPGKLLTRCPVCGYGRNYGAVQEFTARTASAITATVFSLHRGLAQQSDDVLLRRLLVFADSRQDTAFQAGYIRGRARAVQVRRLIIQAGRAREAAGRPPASFDGLVEDVFRLGRDIGLYDDPAGQDAAHRVRRVCEWDILGEVASDERRPPTLERLGMITVGYPALDRLSAAELSSLIDTVGSDTNSSRSAGHGDPAAGEHDLCVPGLPRRAAATLATQPLRHVQLSGRDGTGARQCGRLRTQTRRGTRLAGRHRGGALRPGAAGAAREHRGTVQNRRAQRARVHHDPRAGS